MMTRALHSKHHSASRSFRNNRGAVALIAVVVTTAFLMVMVGTVWLLGENALEFGAGGLVSEKTLLAGESCLEESLIRLSRNSSYAGGSLAIDDVNCTQTVTGTPCGNCQIDVVATRAQNTRRLRAHISMTGSKVTILDWAEMP